MHWGTQGTYRTYLVSLIFRMLGEGPQADWVSNGESGWVLVSLQESMAEPTQVGTRSSGARRHGGPGCKTRGHKERGGSEARRPRMQDSGSQGARGLGGTEAQDAGLGG